jgi:hypothetical protein
VSNAEYQDVLRQLGEEYNVTSKNRANMPHLEIAAIFLAHAINYFMKTHGMLVFVLPRSFMTAHQHENTRDGEVDAVKIERIWDLNDVNPLFRVPACVFFARHGGKLKAERQIPDTGIPGLCFAGHLPRPHIHWDEAKRFLSVDKITWYYSRLNSKGRQTRSAITKTNTENLFGTNDYEDQFSQGATIVPRTFYFVEFESAVPEDFMNRVCAVHTAKMTIREGKEPWKSQVCAGRVEGAYFYRTAISKNIVPFAINNTPLVLLPMTVEADERGHKYYVLHDSEKLLSMGAKYASQWFWNAEKLWTKHRTEACERNKINLIDWLDWQHKLTQQDPSAQYLIIYTSSSADTCAAVIDRTTFDVPFVVDHKAYWCRTSTLKEAHYLSAFLNSGYANGKIKAFQSQGLFGPRDIHKLIVKIPFPQYEKDNIYHNNLAELGEKCHIESTAFLKQAQLPDLGPQALGRLRGRIRLMLEEMVEEIDVIVEQLSSGESESTIRASAASKKRRKPKSMPLFQ